MELETFSPNNMHFKMASAKLIPFYSDLIVITVDVTVKYRYINI